MKQSKKAAAVKSEVLDEDYEPSSMESPKPQKPETSRGKSALGIQEEELPPSLKK